MDQENNVVKNNRIVIAVILSFTVFYTFIIYTQSSVSEANITAAALRGQQLWQKNNCSSCHQLYGLGGYLGPDLTNAHSDPKKGPAYIKAFLNSGVKTMPKFEFSESEKEEIVAFLKAVDETGIYPSLNAEIRADGWVKIETRDEE